MGGEVEEEESNEAGDVIRAGASLAGSLLALFGQKVQIIRDMCAQAFGSFRLRLCCQSNRHLLYGDFLAELSISLTAKLDSLLAPIN